MDVDLTDRDREYLEALPAPSYEAWGDALEVAATTAESAKDRLNQVAGIQIEKVGGEWQNVGEFTLDDHEPETSSLPDLDDVNAEGEPDPSELTNREEYIVRELQTGTTVDELADDLDERPTIVTQHLRDLKRYGWRVYHDESAEHFTIEGEHTLRSSEHKGTRTRKANRWWEMRHAAVEREWKTVDPYDVSLVSKPGNEDWVTHVTDLHAGDVVRDYSGDIVYRTEEIPRIIGYITQQSIRLSEKHNAEYDTAHLLWGGDMVTNEAIYQGQFEDLDAWLDEQVDVVQRALTRQVNTFADRFDTVNVVAQIGNHGVNRASGTSKHNNADLILYKAIRNFVNLSQDFWEKVPNVRIQIGEARPYTPVNLRGGEIHGQLRHGQNRKPQAETSARLKEWLSTLLDTINSSWGAFDVAWMGHHHVSGRIPWNGPPILVSGSPKPGGDYVEKLGVKGQATMPQEIGHCHGVSDDGVTSIWPIDNRHFDYTEHPDT